MKAMILAPLFCAICIIAACVSTQTVTTNPDGTTTTNTVQTLDITKTTNAINSVVPVAVRLAVAKDPNVRKYLQDAAAAILLFTSTSSTFDPNALNAAIAGAVGGDTVSADAVAAIDAGVGLFKAYYGDALVGKIPPQYVAVLNALANSINAGLAPAK